MALGNQTYIVKSDGNAFRIPGKPGAVGPDGMAGRDGVGHLITSDVAPTVRDNGAPLEVGDMWGSTLETPVTFQLVYNTWGSSGAYTGSAAWGKPAVYAMSVFVAPTAGVLVIQGQISIIGNNLIGGAIWNVLNATAGAVGSASGHYQRHSSGTADKLVYPCVMARALALGDTLKFCPAVNASGSVTCDGGLLFSTFYPYATLKSI